MVIAALVLAWAPIPTGVVEAVYSNAVFAVLQPLLTSVSNVAPIALFDVLLLVVIIALALLIGRDLIRCGWRAAIGPIAFRVVVWASAAYVAFLVCWGFNYRRVRLIERLAYSAATVNEAAAATLLTTSVDRLNGLHRSAHAAGWPAMATIDPALAGAFDRMARELGTAHRVVIGRPKRTMLEWYFRRAGVDGMTDPYLLETLVNSDLLPFERPFVIAHEWSHLAGLADEGDANFGAWLTCLRGSVADQYSAWLSLFGELSAAVPARDRGAIVGRLAQGPRDDLRAIRARVAANVVPRLSAAGWRVYDSYLKANRVEAGAASYGEVVRLILGARLPDGSRAY